MENKFEGVKVILLDWGNCLGEELSLWRDRIKRTIDANNLNITIDEFFSMVLEGSRKQMNAYRWPKKLLNWEIDVPWDFENEFIFPGVIDRLKVIKEKYKIAVVANQPPMFMERLKKFHLENFFDLVVGSQDVGFEKPDPRIFEYALNYFNIKPEEAVMIGDRYENDIAPTIKIGIKTIWLKQDVTEVQYLFDGQKEPDAIAPTTYSALEYFL
ncbi:MAG: HAD family hydrolase [Gammaproteobacteria bacterium]|nr:HAD family hydrolase [Gammaproteobacteria bacterium]